MALVYAKNNNSEVIKNFRGRKGDVFISTTKENELYISFKGGAEKKILSNETEYMNLALDPEKPHRLYFDKANNVDDGWKVYFSSNGTKALKTSIKEYYEWGKDAKGGYFLKFDKNENLYYITKKTETQPEHWIQFEVSKDACDEMGEAIRLAEKLIKIVKEKNNGSK